MRLPRPESLRGRVTWAVLALLAVILVVLFTAVDIALSARLQADARTRLTDRVALAAQLDPQLSAQQLVDRLRGDGVTARLCVRDGGGCVAAASDPAPPGRRNPPGGEARPRRTGAAQAEVPVETAGSVIFVRTELRGNQVLTLSLDTTQITDAVHRLIVLEVIGGLLALLLAGLASARVSRAALRPLEDMTALAGQIAAGDRGRRLGHQRTDSELGRTAAAFDSMLDELEAALATANAAEAGMRSFLADASHELRTPMAGLQANAELLLREELDRPERERVAVAMIRETRRAARLVDDLLTMARLGQGGVRLATERVDLARLAEAEVSRARTLAPSLTFTVTAPATEPGPVVLGDPLRLGQILTNLLDNARHATPAGGTITVDVRRSGERVLLEVADTGPGVPATERALIFERFGRGDASRSRDTGGAGLGLPIARGLAVAHGGELTYADSPAGARFQVDLPAAT
ncbi:cell wall metabolism sensor histidine kinase WalK [Actinoplanes sp. ATCC 53533]|uniref:sensor histidine kinase n=1 Tax=Actinoplanes sp. ATCC 53533 TaxID=1288362 RepID=UPI000F7945DE|nr:HAMP domain-containing sensor histidine kinase [Actinoplanes sp. ATCC 53533]